MAIINFTVNADALASDADDHDGDTAAVPLTGTATFTPLFADNRPALAPGYSPRPALFHIRQFDGIFDSTGRLRSEHGGDIGVRLWANDPVFNLGELWYRVDIEVTTLIGEPVALRGGAFRAPSTDVVINLADVLQQTGSSGAGITRGDSVDGVRFDNGQLIFSVGQTDLDPVSLGDAVITDSGGGTAQFSIDAAFFEIVDSGGGTVEVAVTSTAELDGGTP